MELASFLSVVVISALLLFFFLFNLYMYKKIKARSAIPAISPAMIPTMAAGLSPLWLSRERPFSDLGEMASGFDEFKVLGIAANAGGEFGEETLGEEEGEDGIGHGFLVGWPHRSGFPRKDSVSWFKKT